MYKCFEIFFTDAAPFKPRRSYEPLFRRDPITNLYSTTSRASPRIPEIGNAFLPSQSNLPPPTPPNTVNSTPTTRLPPDNFGNSQTSQGTVLKVKVTKTKKFHDGDTKIPTYSTHSKERGKVLVLNNIKFSGDLYRKGAKLDEKNVVSLFQQMGFDVKSHRDKTKKVSKILLSL